MQDDKHNEFFLAFVSIIFGIYVAEWARPVVDFLKIHTSHEVYLYFQFANIIKITQCALTLGVIVCLWWWYGFVLGRYDPARGLFMYAYDFATLGCFAVASGIWKNVQIFPVVVLIACVLVGVRFFIARLKLRHNKKLNSVLKWAIGTVVVSIIIFGIGLIIFLFGASSVDTPVPHSHGVVIFSSANIFVMVCCIIATIFCASKMEGGLGWGRNFPFQLTTYMAGDKLMLNPDSTAAALSSYDLEGCKMRCELGLHEFRRKMIDMTRYESPCISQVHSVHDLHSQAFLPAYASLNHTEEVTKKSEMMYFVHWFDDLVDQGNIKKIDAIIAANGEKVFDKLLSVFFDQPSEINNFIKSFIDKYRSEAGKKFFRLGLVRVMLGSKLFQDDSTATKAHDIHQKVLGTALGDQAGILEIINGQFIDLSVKTVQEFWHGLEDPVLPFYYTFLFSILYGPALYYHNFEEEGNRSESAKGWMRFDEGDAVAMIKSVGEKIKISATAVHDRRLNLRALEIRGVAHTFDIVLPTKVKEAYLTLADELEKFAKAPENKAAVG